MVTYLELLKSENIHAAHPILHAEDFFFSSFCWVIERGFEYCFYYTRIVSKFTIIVSWQPETLNWKQLPAASGNKVDESGKTEPTLLSYGL